MTTNEPKPESTTSDTPNASLSGRNIASTSDEAGEQDIPPTLAAYFEESNASPATLFRVLKKNKVTRFKPLDQETAAQSMRARDPNGERLWALMSQQSLPEAVDVWIWNAAQDRLGERLGEAFDPREYDSSKLLSELLNALSQELRSKDAEARKRAETWLRIGLCWLIERRSLNAWCIARALRHALFPEASSALKSARKAIQKGKSSELRLAVAMVMLGDQMVRSAEQERAGERSIASDLRHRLDQAQTTISALQSELRDLKLKVSAHEGNLLQLEQMLAAERQHWGHDMTEAKAEQRTLLGERLGPLLEDATDALEIDPPAPATALRRLKSALAVIKEANE